MLIFWVSLSALDILIVGVPGSFRAGHAGFLRVGSRKKKAHKLNKNRRDTGPGVPGTPGGTNRGLPAGVPDTSCCLP